MKHADLRAHLQAVAKGKEPAAAVRDAPIVDLDLLEREQPAFKAWERFASVTDRDAFDDDRRGEALIAPAELLSPLP